jgi:anti-anti-sigma factor
LIEKAVNALLNKLVIKDTIHKRKKGDNSVASNFKIVTRRRGVDLRIKLKGDFDGNSAFELLHLIDKKCDGIVKVIIDTSELSYVYSFGREVFCNNLSRLNGRSIQLIFINGNSDSIAPERNKFAQVLQCHCIVLKENNVVMNIHDAQEITTRKVSVTNY